MNFESDYQWGPGDLIPHTENEEVPPQSIVMSEIREEMESKVETALSDLNDKISHVESRIKAIEEKPHLSTPSSSSGESSPACKRRRRSPPELQVVLTSLYLTASINFDNLQFQIRTVHASFRDENKFHCHDR